MALKRQKCDPVGWSQVADECGGLGRHPDHALDPIEIDVGLEDNHDQARHGLGEGSTGRPDAVFRR